jgi:hypothetical protein
MLRQSSGAIDNQYLVANNDLMSQVEPQIQEYDVDVEESDINQSFDLRHINDGCDLLGSPVLESGIN